MAGATTAVAACGGSTPATATKPAAKDEHGAPAKTAAKDEHGAPAKTAAKDDGHGAPAKAGAADAHGGGLADELWVKSGGDDLLKGKTFQTLFNGLATKGRALELKDTYMRCIDEGCPGGIHLAGSGCLYEKAAEDF